jgi:NADH-ubiquinone oxidoreductase chain 1
MILPILIRVAFITLLERKILGLSQFRKGPNKVRFYGILQPIADAVKLFLKEVSFTYQINKFIFCLGPMLALGLIALLVSLLPGDSSRGFMYGGVMVVVIISLGIYPLFLQGWRSNSKYSLLGAVRGIAQTISYEISLALALFIFFLCVKNFNISREFYYSYSNLFILAPPFLLLLISCVAETNRTPFDFSEGESELVSGFNTEYGGGLFALIFIAEYGMIIFFCVFIRALVAQDSNFRTLALFLSQGLIFF